MVLKAADEQQSPPSGVLIKKIKQLRAVRSFSWNAVFFKYILGCLCKTVSIRYNKTERHITMEFTGSYRHKLKYPISLAVALALRQRLRAVMKRNPHTVYMIQRRFSSTNSSQRACTSSRVHRKSASLGWLCGFAYASRRDRHSGILQRRREKRCISVLKIRSSVSRRDSLT